MAIAILHDCNGFEHLRYSLEKKQRLPSFLACMIAKKTSCRFSMELRARLPNCSLGDARASGDSEVAGISLVSYWIFR